MKLTSALATTILAASVAGGLSVAQPAAATTPSPVVALAAGDEHSCALYADGAVQCWGGNDFGQLGNPDVESSAVPVPVALPAGAEAVAIDTGAFHTCAVTRDHSVYCWGDNGWGSLGIGNSPAQRVPVLVTLAPSAAVASDVTAGGFTTCVSMSNGTAQCWGRNQYAEVGDGTRIMRNTPTPVVGIADAVDIDAGTNHVCVLRSVGRAQCWGRSVDGRTGDSTFVNVAEVSAGGAHTCMRTTVGGLRCWGVNTYGQLTPNNIDAGITRVSTGGAHTCVATDGGIVRCWGEAGFGQLGVSTVIVEGRSVLETAAGLRHTCARLDDSSVWCWGNSVSGQAGDHSLTIAAQPVLLIAGLPPVAPTPSQPEPAPSQPETPAPAPEPAPSQPVIETPVEAPVQVDPVAPQPVEKQVADATPESATVTPPAVVPPVAMGPAPIAKRGVLELRLGREANLVRIARAAGVRLPGSLIAESLSRARSVSAHPFTRLRVEMKVSHLRNCRNALTPVLGAAVRATRVGECRVTLRISRAGRPDIVRTVLVQTVAMVAPVNNPARNTR
jgi:alpha-tubulin suppressor-like RCC1 family protein